jgi:hypothetical protein
MSQLLDARGRTQDPFLTPKQNLDMHLQTREMLQQGFKQQFEHFQTQLYQQALFIEYLTTKLQEQGFSLDPEAFAAWAEVKHAELLEAENEKAKAAVEQLVAQAPRVQLEE